jgi:predicted esterase
MAFETRLAAGASICGFSLVRLLVERSISHNLALYLPGMLPDLDFDVLVPALAPRPLFVSAARADALYPVEGVRVVERAARRAYSRHNARGAIVFRYFDGPHGLPAAELAAAVSWLRQALGRIGRAAAIPDRPKKKARGSP